MTRWCERLSTRASYEVQSLVAPKRPQCITTGAILNIQKLHTRTRIDLRQRASSFWLPTSAQKDNDSPKDGFSLLRDAGFIRQASAGVFHFLPLGLRVQTKLELLIDRHMQSIGASKLSLSSLSTESLWQKSGRIAKSLKESTDHEFLSINDRKQSRYLLAPTHEEEITALVSVIVKSYKDLPLRLYQISRKYRDELRPRQGLLRAKEFLMKDLYTFDGSIITAMKTYEAVRNAYARIFSDLGLPCVVAEADSGTMGGKHSHEYHLVSSLGEDTVFTCSTCGYTANEEVVEKSNSTTAHVVDIKGRSAIWRGISTDRKLLVVVHYCSRADIQDQSMEDVLDLRAVKDVIPELDTAIQRLSSAQLETFQPTAEVHLIDSTLAEHLSDDTVLSKQSSQRTTAQVLRKHPSRGDLLDLRKPTSGSSCPRCADGSLQTTRCIEVGHTFFLGTRYSKPFNAVVASPSSSNVGESKSGSQSPVPLQMGCHGIGVSRLVGAIAALMCDGDGLQWPRAIAPFDVVIIPSSGLDADARTVYDTMTLDSSIDVLLDDREKSMGWKLKDADLIGSSLSVILGRDWKTSGLVEIKCRSQPNLSTTVPLEELRMTCLNILQQLR